MEFTLQVRNVRTQEQYHNLTGAIDELGSPRMEINYWDKVAKDCYFRPNEDWLTNCEDLTTISQNFPEMYFMLECTPDEYSPYGIHYMPWKRYFQAGDTEWCGSSIFFDEPTRIVWKDNNNTFSMDEISW